MMCLKRGSLPTSWKLLQSHHGPINSYLPVASRTLSARRAEPSESSSDQLPSHFKQFADVGEAPLTDKCTGLAKYLRVVGGGAAGEPLASYDICAGADGEDPLPFEFSKLCHHLGGDGPSAP